MNIRTRVGATAGVLAVASMVLAISVNRARPDELNRSVEVLLSERLGLSYRIVKKTLYPAETDESGVWWIKLDEKSSRRLSEIGHPDLAPADADDTECFRSMINDELGGAAPIGQSRLLRGEIVLGHGTICEELPCNIHLLVHPDDRNVFVSISKT